MYSPLDQFDFIFYDTILFIPPHDKGPLWIPNFLYFADGYIIKPSFADPVTTKWGEEVYITKWVPSCTVPGEWVLNHLKNNDGRFRLLFDFIWSNYVFVCFYASLFIARFSGVIMYDRWAKPALFPTRKFIRFLSIWCWKRGDHDQWFVIPNLMQFKMEFLYKFIFNIVINQVGHKGIKHFPWIFSLFIYILILNLLGMMPFGIAFTAHFIPVLYLSFTVCLGMFITGIYYHGLIFLKIFIPECPPVMLLLLIVIEIFSYIIKAFSLAIRLSANIMAGHTLVGIITAFALNIIKLKLWFFLPIVLLLLLFILSLELGVAFLQAYVFIILISIYLAEAYKGPVH